VRRPCKLIYIEEQYIKFEGVEPGGDIDLILAGVIQGGWVMSMGWCSWSGWPLGTFVRATVNKEGATNVPLLPHHKSPIAPFYTTSPYPHPEAYRNVK